MGIVWPLVTGGHQTKMPRHWQALHGHNDELLNAVTALLPSVGMEYMQLLGLWCRQCVSVIIIRWLRSLSICVTKMESFVISCGCSTELFLYVHLSESLCIYTACICNWNHMQIIKYTADWICEVLDRWKHFHDKYKWSLDLHTVIKVMWLK